MAEHNFISLHLGDRFLRAVSYARDLHVENRKATQVPYMAHLLGVASLVMGESGYVEFPITENEVIGALLHDAAEDWGGHSRLDDIRAMFGDIVATHVKGCTDTFEDLLIHAGDFTFFSHSMMSEGAAPANPVTLLSGNIPQ